MERTEPRLVGEVMEESFIYKLYKERYGTDGIVFVPLCAAGIPEGEEDDL